MVKECEKCGRIIDTTGTEYIFTTCKDEGIIDCTKQEIIPPGYTPQEWERKQKDKLLKRKLQRITKEKPKKKPDIEIQIKREITRQLKQETVNMQSRINTEISKLKDEIKKVRQEYYNQANKIFENPKFWEKFNVQIEKWISKSIDIKIQNADYHRLVRESVSSVLKDELRIVIREVVESVMKTINKKFTNEYDNARKLCYSIESEIKHTLQKSPIGMQESNYIYKKINRLLDVKLKLAETKRLEDKKNEL